MSKEKKYIIKYKMNDFHKWCYSTIITDTHTYSYVHRDLESITKMTLKEAKKNVIKIKKIRENKPSRITEIYIINIETNKTIDSTIYKPKKISRFEIMEI